MSDLWDPPAPRKKPIPREAWRQEKAVVWVRSAVLEPHIFLAYDRAASRGDKSHLWQWKRGQKAGVLDTELILADRSLRFEFKSLTAKVDENDDQGQMIMRLRALRHAADWGRTIVDLCAFYRLHGVVLAQNAEYQAIHYDGLVDSRIAKEEGPKVPRKKSRPARGKGGTQMPMAAYRRANARGLV